VVVVQVHPFWSRCLEHLLLHVVGSSVLASIAFTAGVFFYGH
jgi:hypothetical protein